MLLLANTFEEICNGAIGGVKCKIADSQLILTDLGTVPILYERSVSDCIVINPHTKIANVFINNTCWCFRWIDMLGQWQNLTSLFAGYGEWGVESDIEPAVNAFNLIDGVCVDICTTDEYAIGLERANNLLFIHTSIYKWGRSAKQHLFADINRLQSIVSTDTYIYSIKPNVEYQQSTDTTFKFAQMVGYRFFDRCTLADGFEHDIYKRERTTTL